LSIRSTALFSSFLAISLLAAPGAAAQAPPAPAPGPAPPVTRSLYRGHWFAFLNAHLEDDARGAASALAEMRQAGRAVGVRRLSDFSRTLVHEARKAESLGKKERAARAYDAALQLDDGNFDAAAERVASLFRSGAYPEALRRVPEVIGTLLRTRESRLSLFSSIAIWGGVAFGATILAGILILLLRHRARLAHDLKEIGRRLGGRGAAVPLALLIFGLPLAFGLGPIWLLLYWGALVFAYTSGVERALLVGGMLALGLLPPFFAAIGRENIVQRSPLYVAAVDLDERREDQSAEDGLQQAATVFRDDPDVWFLLGRYAERRGEFQRAVAAYDRAIQVDSRDYRHFVSRGNVYFLDSDFPSAIRDYRAAADRAPDAPEVHYNLALALGEAYDFPGQRAAIARARQLDPERVKIWTETPNLQRVVAPSYGLDRARARVERWNAQARSRRLPGHAAPYRIDQILLSPLVLGPWGALLLGVLLARNRSRIPPSEPCARCGAPYCGFCKRYGDPPLYCSTCVRLHLRREDAGIQAHVAQADEVRRRTRSDDRICRLLSLLFPGTHRFFTERTLAGAVTLLLFFFALAAFLLGHRLFDPRQLAVEGWRLAVGVAAVAALAVWFVANVSAWRESHGS
jgi:tetratricopeptide (TPR) repeat protein